MSATLPPVSAAAVRRPRRSLRFTRDDELVRLLRAGDERAFEVLYDRHHRGILSFARHMLGSKEEAEDAVQHTFIAAHRDLAGSDKPIQLKAWLYTIARNRCLSMLRSRREERALDDVPEPSVEGLASAVQRRQDLRDMLADLQRLPEDQRAALVLAELGALSHEEIADTLGVRKDKVKALVFQARESLASSRNARDADCGEIQEQLAVLRGGALRRTELRRHVDVCPACAAFKAEVQRQRSAMACLLPVVPSVALKETVLVAAGGAAIGGGGGGAALGGGLLAAGGTKALVAKVATIAVVAGGSAGGGIMAVDELGTGGGGGTATAMAGVPAESKAVEMVGQLRQRARRTAEQRQADRASAGAGRNGAATPAAAPAGDSGRSGDRVVGRRPEGERRARPGAVARVRHDASILGGSVGGAAPISPAAAPVQPAARPAHPGDDHGDDSSDERGDKGKQRKHKKPKKHKRAGRKGRGVQAPAGAPTPGEDDEREDDDTHEEKAAAKQQRAAERVAAEQQREAAEQQRAAEREAAEQQQEAAEQQREAAEEQRGADRKRGRAPRPGSVPQPGADKRRGADKGDRRKGATRDRGPRPAAPPRPQPALPSGDDDGGEDGRGGKAGGKHARASAALADPRR